LVIIHEVIKMIYAKSLGNLLSDNEMEKMLNRHEETTPVYEHMRKRWTTELFERSPTPAYRYGEYKGTNLDMVSMLNTLAGREAVINFPEYRSKGVARKNEDEWIVSSKNRHGKLLGLIGKRDTFSFSARIEDQNVVDLQENKTGKYRNFLLTDSDGNFYAGARTIEIPSHKDISRFLDAYGLPLRQYDMSRKERMSGSKVVRFHNFVQPNLWQAFFSADYIKAKALEKRLEDEGKHYRNAASGIKRSLGLDELQIQHWQSEPGVTQKITTLEAELDTPGFRGSYEPVRFSENGMEQALAKANGISYSILPRLRFNTRAVELAFFKYGKNGELNPGWSVPDIEEGYKLPGKRTEWNRMQIDDDLSLRYRILERTERVSPHSI
jgi:hypothetical protein